VSPAAEKTLIGHMRFCRCQPFQFGKIRRANAAWALLRIFVYDLHMRRLESRNPDPELALGRLSRGSKLYGRPRPTEFARSLCTEVTNVRGGIGWHRDKPHFFTGCFGTVARPRRAKFPVRRPAYTKVERFSRSKTFGRGSIYMMSVPSREAWGTQHITCRRGRQRYSITFPDMAAKILMARP